MPPPWRFTQTVTTSSLLAVAVVNRDIVWAADGGFEPPGEPLNPGVVVRTVDGGQSCQDITPPGGKDLKFHDVKAFDRNHALVLAVGFGEDSKVFRTADGAHWDLVFQNEEPEAFYDGIAFFNRRPGIALSDPVEGKFRILATDDGGHHWHVASTDGMPPAMDREAGRATGTCLVTRGLHHAWFGTQPDGPNSRVFRTRDRGHTWSVATTPIPGGPDQFGIASLAFRDTQHGLALGGSGPDTDAPSVIAATADGGATWSRVGSPAGFRTSISIPTNRRRFAVAAGFTGSDFATDGGDTWHLFDQTDLRGVNCKRNVSCWP
jgi:photosystem II stability/assembly factor-like uncharacterized protein